MKNKKKSIHGKDMPKALKSIFTLIDNTLAAEVIHWLNHKGDRESVLEMKVLLRDTHPLDYDEYPF